MNRDWEGCVYSKGFREQNFIRFSMKYIFPQVVKTHYFRASLLLRGRAETIDEALPLPSPI